MSAYRVCGRSLVVVCCLLAACHVEKQGAGTDNVPGGSAGTQSPEMIGDGGSGSGSGSGAGGTSGRAPTSAGEAGAGQDSNGGAAGAAGEAGAAGAAGGQEGPPPVCEIDGGSCVSNVISACRSPSATCSITDLGYSCEFTEFKNASATVACQATATVGIACCGGCGCVNVEVYYDGKYCWQGIPDCSLMEYSGKLFNPQLP